MNARHRGDWQGMNWIRQEKRLAIYLRDGCACVYCGATIETGAILSLDHLKPHSKGGNNHESNLITCCKSCNDRRNNRSLSTWIRIVAAYVNHGITADDIRADIRRLTSRKLSKFRVEAKRLIARRGSAAKALQYVK